jgi:hypothetical protein
VCGRKRGLVCFSPTGDGYRIRECRDCERVSREQRRQERLRRGPMVRLVCCKCGNEFTRPLKWRQPSRSTGRVYCLQPCRPNSHRYDPLSSFRFFRKPSQLQVQPDRGSARQRSVTITPKYLQGIWIAQAGICPLTGWRMILPSASRPRWPGGHSPRNASLDRINQARGYICGNVRFVCLIANYARHSWTDADVLIFAAAIVEHGATNATSNTSADAMDVPSPNQDMGGVNRACVPEEGGRTRII